eukprot:TRINITY_DN15767_c1_g1_i1.p1 TRINITY_DN15767_c1_g1~~TRINITY_DN15767_c1_g1_i1.p1  ORF type:complete len:155 (+),score=11.59 TRINITY_DN15767_c1_g1_i1:56-466(+)
MAFATFSLLMMATASLGSTGWPDSSSVEEFCKGRENGAYCVANDLVHCNHYYGVASTVETCPYGCTQDTFRGYYNAHCVTAPDDDATTTSGPSERTIVHGPLCDCSWIPEDNCTAKDPCAIFCRHANPWGPCGQTR